jgi:tryptophan synthase alpha chain
MTAGFPTRLKATNVFHDLERGGADIIEIGVPFSDPIADGPTIQYSSHRALEQGVSLREILIWVAHLRKKSSTPIVLMSYTNPLLRMGFGRFAEAAFRAGVDGLIVPDMIPEEAAPLRGVLAKKGIDLIFLVAPTTHPKRRRWVASQSKGFLYGVSLTGVTGARSDLSPGVVDFLKALQGESPIPVAVGFGVSTPSQVRALAPHVDGVIVGSAFIQRLREGKPLAPFVQSLRLALDKGGFHAR